MNKYTKEQLAEMTGEKDYRQGPVGGEYFDTITLGKDGKFYVNYYSQPKDERSDPDTVKSPFTGVIVRIRRKMIAWENKEKTFESIEYDAGTDLVHSTHGDISEKDAKKQYGAKVQLVLYILVGDSIRKLTVSGGSLYNPEDEDDMRLYSYLQSFEDDEHTFMFTTKIGAKENTYIDGDGVESSNYQMTFARGTALKDLLKVGDAIMSLTESLKECDERDVKFLGKSSKSTTTAVQEEINADDVEF